MDKVVLRKALKGHFIQSFLLYLVVWLMWSFTDWDILAPYKSICNLPNVEPMSRFNTISIWLVYNLISIVTCYDINKKNRK